MSLRVILSLLIVFFIVPSAFAQDGLRTDFINNKCSICAINIRNFNAKDTNNNGIIDGDEESGTFLNAIERLDEIKAAGINTLHVLPITPTGKLKALGTAGSLYAMSDLSSINHQIVDLTSKLKPIEQAKLFVDECHKRGIKVIVDMPSCGSYDMFLSHPELFITNKKNMSVVPTDWTDVRLFDTGKDEKLNQDLVDAHKKYIDMVVSIGADGIRADVATIKPATFWSEIISYARAKNPEMLFLAEASDSWREPPSKYAEFTPYDKLLEVGFDGYYGSFFNIKDWKNSNDLIEHIKFNKKILNSYSEGKSVILSFTTHDEVSPVVLHGEDFSVMICWLEATLPFNQYFVDGFQSGDTYIYPWANSKAAFSETDDDYYFVHHGQLDIFNFSRKPGGNSELIKNNFKRSMMFRNNNLDLITKGTFTVHKTKKDSVFAYSRNYQGETILIMGNLDHKRLQRRVTVKVSGIKKKNILEVIQGNANYKTKNNKVITDLEPGQIKVFKLTNLSL